jgi:hypothetical protein
MRLLDKPKKSYFKGVGSTSDNPKYNQENRGIAGVAFGLKKHFDGSDLLGTTGYFIEIEDVANITGRQLEDGKYENLRFYKVSIDSTGKFIPTLLKQAWVDVVATAGESIDFAQTSLNNGSSYVIASDISVIIKREKNRNVYTVYWQGWKVIQYSEPKSSQINRNSTVAGVMVRSDSSAMFDYFLGSSVPENKLFSVSSVLEDDSEKLNISSANERGLLPILVAKNRSASQNIFYEDFGNQLREAIHFDVRFETPSVTSHLLDLTDSNKNYHIADYSSSSYGANFWVFNTSRSSITLGADSQAPINITGVTINQVNSGEVELGNYLDERYGDEESAKNSVSYVKNLYGESNLRLQSEYINNSNQAKSLLDWVFKNSMVEKDTVSVSMFPNPLIELGDKVRVFYPEMGHNIENPKNGDKVYYVTSIQYSVGIEGPGMTLEAREI